MSIEPQPSSQSEIDGICILALRGSLSIGESEAGLRRSVSELAGAGTVNLILNLEELRTIDDDGLSALLLCEEQLRSLGGSLKLLNMKHIHMELSILLRLEMMFPIFEDQQDAVDSFFPKRLVPHYDILKFVEEQEKDPAFGAPRLDSQQ